MKNLFLLLVSFIIVSCNNNDEPEPATTPFVPITINSTLVGKHRLSGSEGVIQQNIIINNNSDWVNLKNQIDSQFIAIGLGNYYTENNFEETTIDFTNFTVMAIFDQVYGNGGHTIDITNITEYETNVIVTVENLETGNTSSSYSQPYHIVKIPKTIKPIFFQ
jgi:hypothetical protein